MALIVPNEIKKIGNQLIQAGHEAYLVGGCVRDMILNRKTNDWDFTTSATPEEILYLFPDSFYDNKFGTVGVPIEITESGKTRKIIVEITTFRSESGYSNHRHPDKIVWGKSLEEDLKRRDFTINAIAYDGTKIYDPFDGQKDLKNKLIKAVGNPEERFFEDALRMIRAVRIATELEFMIEDKTFLAIKKLSYLIKKISPERIRDELFKILKSKYPADGIKLLKNSGLLEVIIPELEKCFGIEQKSPKRHHIYDVGTHLLNSLAKCPSSDPIVRLAALLHDIGKPLTFKKTADGIITFYNHEIISASIATNIANRFNFSKKDREKLTKLVRWHQFSIDEKQTDSAIRRIIRNVGPENIHDLLAVRIADRLGGGARETSWRLELFKKRLIEVQKQPFTVADLKVDGYDVMKIYNIGPGPLVGAVLNMLFNDVISGKLPNEREILIQRIHDLKKESKLKISSILPKPPKAEQH